MTRLITSCVNDSEGKILTGVENREIKIPKITAWRKLNELYEGVMK